ncbi:uncharacterized protein EV422DRAFT_226327 [Fimicolochytrium jonesii]|uniref:uncharacterized protein n=1 Tax=Fimicolochytrium jonesii TaxID=1396493 RepID=UPI0022FDB64D|nr:uncharacterized protein EV422DRAFT_226327 [Fimicolochytrium jonesii]KAI8817479.1 hypothetical protein EV422DRAFT_226327 [Fimicolochytrium jonesii]
MTSPTAHSTPTLPLPKPSTAGTAPAKLDPRHTTTNDILPSSGNILDFTTSLETVIGAPFASGHTSRAGSDHGDDDHGNNDDEEREGEDLIGRAAEPEHGGTARWSDLVTGDVHRRRGDDDDDNVGQAQRRDEDEEQFSEEDYHKLVDAVQREEREKDGGDAQQQDEFTEEDYRKLIIRVERQRSSRSVGEGAAAFWGNDNNGESDDDDDEVDDDLMEAYEQLYEDAQDEANEELQQEADMRKNAGDDQDEDETGKTEEQIRTEKWHKRFTDAVKAHRASIAAREHQKTTTNTQTVSPQQPARDPFHPAGILRNPLKAPPPTWHPACFCQWEYYGRMVECTKLLKGCKGWYHFPCVGFHRQWTNAPSEDWTCPLCVVSERLGVTEKEKGLEGGEAVEPVGRALPTTKKTKTAATTTTTTTKKPTTTRKRKVNTEDSSANQPTQKAPRRPTPSVSSSTAKTTREPASKKEKLPPPPVSHSSKTRSANSKVLRARVVSTRK